MRRWINIVVFFVSLGLIIAGIVNIALSFQYIDQLQRSGDYSLALRSAYHMLIGVLVFVVGMLVFIVAILLIIRSITVKKPNDNNPSPIQ